jgi:predicted O-methyltransferase YrrM
MKLKDILRLGTDYFGFLLKSRPSSGHRIHSPFIYEFTREVLYIRIKNNELKQIDDYIRKQKMNNTYVTMTDLGAVSKWTKYDWRKIRDIVSYSSSNKKKGKFLYSFTRWFSPDKIIELGTCVGIGTMYLSKGSPRSEIITVEGNNALADIAIEGFNSIDCHNISLVKGNFDDVLQTLQKSLQGRVLVYMDGNHQYIPTMKYFDFFYSVMKDGCIIIDDIRWSPEMKKAWHQIINRNDVFISIDLFNKGLVFKREGLNKQHMRIRY